MTDNVSRRRERAYSTVSQHSTPDIETHNSPRKSRQGGRNGSRLSIKGSRTEGMSVDIIVNTTGAGDTYPPTRRQKRTEKKTKSRKRKDGRKKEQARLPVDEGGVNRKLEIRDQARDCNDRVEEAMSQFDKSLMKDEYKLQGRYARMGTSYDVLNEIKVETEVLVTNLDRIGWDRDEVMEDLGNWMAGRSGEAASMDRELRTQLLDGQEQVRDLVKESINDMLTRMNLFKGTSQQLSGIFDRAVETAAREIKEGVKKGAKIAVAHEKEKMTASKQAIGRALREEEATVVVEAAAGDQKDAVEKANDALKAQPDPAILSFIGKFIVCRDRMRRAEGAIRKFELASFAAEDKFNRATSDWEENRKKLHLKIKDGRDALRLAEKKLGRSNMKAREKEVRDRRQQETQSFVEKQSNRKGTEMLKMQISTLKNRVRELERDIESAENITDKLRMEVEVLEEKLEGTKNMVTREEYDDIKRQLFEASDLVDEARAETVAAQKDTADAKAETEKAYEEKALVMDELSHAKDKIKAQNGEIQALKIAVEEAEIEKKRALAEQKKEYERLLEEEREKTEEQRQRAVEAEEAAEKLQDQIDALEQQIVDLKEEHEAAMDALKEAHEEEKRRMEEEFAAEKQILEDKIAAAEEDLNHVKAAANQMLVVALQELKSETVLLSTAAVSLYGRSEILRKVAEEGLTPPEPESNALTIEISKLVVGSAIDLSDAKSENVQQLAAAAAAYRLSSAYNNVLDVIVNTTAYKTGLLDTLEFVDGIIDSALVSTFEERKKKDGESFHGKHTSIAKSVDNVRQIQLPSSAEDEVELNNIMECRAAITENRLEQRKEREGAAKRQAETLIAIRQFLIEETRRCEEARDALAKLDVEAGKVQYYLETGGLMENGPTLPEVLTSLRARRMDSTWVADDALLGAGVLITTPTISLELVQQSSEAFNITVSTMIDLKIAIIENGTEPDGSESNVVREIRKNIMVAVNDLQKVRKELAIAANLDHPDMHAVIDISAEINRAEMMLLKHEEDASEMHGAIDRRRADSSDRRSEMCQLLADVINEESIQREEVREQLLAQKEGETREKMESLETAVETAAIIYQKIHEQVIQLREELTRAEALKGRLSDYIGSSGQLGDNIKLLKDVRQTRGVNGIRINQAISIGVELSNIPVTTLETMSTLYGQIEDWICSGGNPEPGQIITQQDAALISTAIQELKAQKFNLLEKHIIRDPIAAVVPGSATNGTIDSSTLNAEEKDKEQKIDNLITSETMQITDDTTDESTLKHLVKVHMEMFCQLLEAQVATVLEPEDADWGTKVNQLTNKLITLEQNITEMWETSQQAYYDSFKDEVLEKLMREKEQLQVQLKSVERNVKKLNKELDRTTKEKEQAEAAVIQATAALEEAETQAEAQAEASGGSRGSSRRSRKSRGSSRMSSRGAGSGQLISGGVEHAARQAKEYTKVAKMVMMLTGIMERLRNVAPPMHRQDIITIPNPVADLSQSILQRLSMLKQSKNEHVNHEKSIEEQEEEHEEALMDAMEAIDENASKHMMKALDQCLTSLAQKTGLGIWVGKPHKTPIEKPKSMRSSLRVSRSNMVRTKGVESKKKKKQHRKQQRKSPQKKHSDVISKAELANQKLYVTELEMELDAMGRQVRGHGKLEEMEYAQKESIRLKRMLISKQFHYLQSKLKAEHAKKNILNDTMENDNQDVSEIDLRAAKFASLNEFANLNKEWDDLKHLAKVQKRSEVRLLNAYESVQKTSNKIVHGSADAFSSKGLQESKTRRDLLRFGILHSTAPGKLILSPIKKNQGRYMKGLVGERKKIKIK
jgi:hypothetical protein